jgi:hypothetical protein
VINAEDGMCSREDVIDSPHMTVISSPAVWLTAGIVKLAMMGGIRWKLIGGLLAGHVKNGLARE